MAPDTSAEALNVLREIESFASIKHPNVLPFLGACLSDSQRCLLVTEYMSGGNLKDWVHGTNGARKPHRRLSERLLMALHVRVVVLWIFTELSCLKIGARAVSIVCARENVYNHRAVGCCTQILGAHSY